MVILLRMRHLAMALSRLPRHPCNVVELEQYQTEGDLAAKWLMEINKIDGLEGKSVIDLGAGNGILGHGAQLLGADVTFVECDLDAAALCRELGNTIEGRVGDVEVPDADIVITNPPWGVQTKGADKIFIESALKIAPIIHIMHSAQATHLPDGELVLEEEFRMPATYSHHTSKTGSTTVRCWRILR